MLCICNIWKKNWNPQQNRRYYGISDQTCHSNTVKWKCVPKQLVHHDS